MAGIDELLEKSKDCMLCPLATQGRSRVVLGAGNPKAEIMFIGEAPGANEDKQGIPFVGAAGQLLNKLLGSIGLNREDIYITNVVKCRPPGNRDPKPDEIEICTNAYLKDQLREMKPKVVATLGRFASSVMLDLKDVSMGRIHGQKFDIDGYTIVPIYHPAAALHSRANLVPLTEDFNKLREYLDERVEEPEIVEIEEQAAEQMGLF